ncbi:HelD family protein [Kineosporia babensis]|uniref:AAA family ATPase n=1 Tax=Kineosporia babensis TaxID=499548 RepID=A0A9X1T1W6_9ACTN|nr:UvrD-helicase domain-containing protein [Kineosporia babensis]MCD5314053.1 AAA family ATPase [Kineosporia babensis]
MVQESQHAAAVLEEQAFLDQALARHSQLLAHLESEASALPTSVEAQARGALLRRRHRELDQARKGLVFGRIDALDGTVRRIGRVGVSNQDEHADPLVLDWRAAAARPFYTATPLQPEGQSRRRHVLVEAATVTGVNDEPLSGGTDNGLVGEGALLSALGQRRTGQMSAAIATLQREQDDIIRAEADGPLIVQGGPGTGKTVVALHRVAYLLFTHEQIADQAVLVLGPSHRFLDYIAQVLPALGETAVVSATCDTLLPGVRVTRSESREQAEIKGREQWQPAIEAYVASLLPAPEDLKVRWEGEQHEVSAARVHQLLTAVRQRPYHQARQVFSGQFREVLTDIIVQARETLLDEVDEGYEDILARFTDGAGTESALTEDEVDEIRESVAASAEVTAVIQAWWPTLEPGLVLRNLLNSKEFLKGHLTGDETALVGCGPSGWASSDIPLLDAVAHELGDAAAPEPGGEFIADRARRQRNWVYGHVVIDEAQELSGMQWQMVLRRCPSRSITAVGDIDQTEAAHRRTSWAQAVGGVFGERWNAAELTICYRTPIEVMDLTGPVLQKAGSLNSPPRAVRSSGFAPWESSVRPEELAAAAQEAVQAMQQRWNGGTVGVVAPHARIAELAAALPGLPVLTSSEAKGLEWDAALVVDPHAIAAEPRGWNRLYVALTRCTQELAQIHLPADV